MTTTATGASREIRDHTALNYVATDPAERDQAQSQRLHQPDHMITTIDPITGRDIADLASSPRTEDVKMVIYFESEETRRQYLAMPTDHPVRLPDNPFDEGYDEG